jgi:hypothetical protein
MNGLTRMPFFAGVKKAKFRKFIEPGTELDVFANIVHDGSGYSVTEARIEPRFTLEFESAVATFDGRGGGIVARDASGTEKRYGAPDDSPQFKKLFDAIDASHAPAPVVCGPEAAMAQTLALNGMHESVGDPTSFPDSMVAADHEAERRYVPGLADTLSRCYDRHELPAESGVGWARVGALVHLDGYHSFPRAGSASGNGRSG